MSDFNSGTDKNHDLGKKGGYNIFKKKGEGEKVNQLTKEVSYKDDNGYRLRFVDSMPATPVQERAGALALVKARKTWLEYPHNHHPSAREAFVDGFLLGMEGFADGFKQQKTP